MTNKKIPKNPQIFTCVFCDYLTYNKKTKTLPYHQNTKIVKILTNPTKKSPKIPRPYLLYLWEIL